MRRLAVILSVSSFGLALGAQEPSTGASQSVQKLDTIEPVKRLEAGVQGKVVDLFKAKSAAAEKLKDPHLDEADRAFAADLVERFDRQISIVAGNSATGTRIIGGARVADYAEFQYQVAVVLTGYRKALDGLICGGSLVDKSWVVTAAHCFRSDTRPSDIHVYTGSAKLSKGGHFVAIKQIVRHDQYDSKTNRNDIALLELATPVSDQKVVQLADVTVEKSVFGFSRNATISGWGDTRQGADSGSDDLRWANAPIVDRTSCGSDYASTGRQIYEGMVCAGGGGTVDTCQGDSGGPLVMRDSSYNTYLEGVTSWGEGCAVRGFPGVYTRVPTYLEWIRSKIQTQPNADR